MSNDPLDVQPHTLPEPPKSSRKQSERPVSAGTFEPIKVPRIYEEICSRIRAQLISGELKAGDKLPPERALAEMLGVSRTTVREAMRALQMNGLIDLRRGSHGGAFLLDNSYSLITQSIYNIIDLRSATFATFFQARISLMEGILRLFLETSSDEEIERLTSLIDEIDELDRRGLVGERSRRLILWGNELAKAVGNSLLEAFICSTSEIMVQYFDFTKSGQLKIAIPMLRKLMLAVKMRDKQKALTVFRKLAIADTKHFMDPLLRPSDEGAAKLSRMLLSEPMRNYLRTTE